MRIISVLPHLTVTKHFSARSRDFMTLFKATILMCLSMIRPVAFDSDASNPDLEGAIQSQYLHKAFTLRGFYADGHLHFDSSGSAQGKVHPGTWTTSVIAIDKTKVSADKVELRGSRLVEEYDSTQSKFIPHRSGRISLS
jgi:hypothetical protein